MNKMRLIIGVPLAMILVFVAYLFVVNMTDTPDLQSKYRQQQLRTPKSNSQEKPESVGTIGDLSLGKMKQARYTSRDLKTKKVSRIFGFEKLLRQAGQDWDIEKPYMKMMEGTFSCELTSDIGTVQVEMVGMQPTPKDAQLEGNVVIHILPSENSKVKESFIYMDDVIFNSNNSQFSTDGPVRFVSDDAEMVGTGMQLIYNSMKQRLELMRIIDLEFIHIKSYEKTASASTAQSAQPESTEIANATQPTETSEEKTSYRATFNNNVMIRYGNQQIYADHVSLSNILLNSSSSKSAKNTDSVTDESACSGVIDEADDLESQKTIEVFVTCDGGITVRPMGFYNKSASENMLIEFVGQPVVIEKKDKLADDYYAVAKCGFLKYDIAQEILDMKAMEQFQKVSLNLDELGSKLETTGSVHWKRSKNSAIVDGPGQIDIIEGNNDSSQMKFAGVMKLYFTQNTDVFKDMPVLDYVDFLGDIEATTKGDQPAEVTANAGRLYFNEDNNVVKADLKGDVLLNSSKGVLQADNADVIFAENSQGQTVPATVTGYGNAKLISPDSEKTDRSSFKAKNIDYDLNTGNAIANGPVEFIFYTQPTDGGTSVPIIVRADENAEFHSKSNQVVLNGNVNGEITEKFPNYKQVNKFYGDKMTIELLSQDDIASSNGLLSGTKLKTLAMIGKFVRLNSERKADGKRLSAIELTADRIDFDAISQMIMATGSRDAAEIQIDNTNTQQPAKQDNKISLKKPCYARIMHFDKLKWFLDKNRISATGDNRRLYMGYLPVDVQGQELDEKKVEVNCGKVVADFVELSSGKSEISTLTASNGVSYQDYRYQFEGGNLFYETGTSFVRIAGSQGHSCMFNGTAVDAIEYNLETQKATAEIGQTPGVLPLR